MAGCEALKFGAELGDDFLRAVLALGFEFDQKITGIGLDDVEAKGPAGAAGIALDFGRLARIFSVWRRARSVSVRLLRGAT